MRAASDSDTLTPLMEDDTGKNSKHVRYSALTNTSLPWTTTWRFESAQLKNVTISSWDRASRWNKQTSIPSSVQQSLGPGVSKEPDVHGHSIGLQRWAASPQSDGYRTHLSGSSDLFGHFSTGGRLCHSTSRLLNIRGRQLKQNFFWNLLFIGYNSNLKYPGGRPTWGKYFSNWKTEEDFRERPKHNSLPD